MNGATIDIQTKDGAVNASVAQPAGDGHWPAVLFFMDGLGWRATLFQMADRLASSGYYVLLPDTFLRSGEFAPFDPKTVFAGGPEMERLRKVVGAVTEDGARSDTEACLEFLARHPKVKDARQIACVGYCMGGGLAIKAACNFPDRIAAAASFHGGRFLTSPEAPEVIAKNVRGRIYIGVAEKDPHHTPEVTRRLTAALDEAKVPYTIELYPGVSHGFAVADLPVYDREAAERHWDRLLRLLRETFS